MDIVEINILTQERKVKNARDNVYKLSGISKEDSTTLILYACRKMYGLRNTVKIIHGLGVRNFGQ